MTIELWYPAATRDVLGDAGTYTGGPGKCVLHTTEGQTYAGARAAYVKNNSNPQMTVSFEGGKFKDWQHCQIDRAGRALVNATGGPQTNRDSVFQIEIVGTCNPANRGKPGWLYVEDFPREYLDGIRGAILWGAKQLSYTLDHPVFKAYPASYGTTNGVRMSNAVWDNFNGVCGHQHVPDGNVHGDPGLIDVTYLLRGETIVPQFDPPLPVASWCNVVGGEVAVAPDGAVFCDPASLYKGGPNGQAYWGARKAAKITARANPDGSYLGYTVTATSGESYSYP